MTKKTCPTIMKNIQSTLKKNLSFAFFLTVEILLQIFYLFIFFWLRKVLHNFVIFFSVKEESVKYIGSHIK